MEAARDLVGGGEGAGGATDEAEVISMVRREGVRWRQGNAEVEKEKGREGRQVKGCRKV